MLKEPIEFFRRKYRGHLVLLWLYLSLCCTLLGAGCGTANPSESKQLLRTSHGVDQGTESSAGGGLAVVCFDTNTLAARVRANNGDLENNDLNHVQSIEMLDLYQARESRGHNSEITPEIATALPGEKHPELIERIIGRFEHVVPALPSLLRRGKEQFPSEAIFWANHGLKSIQDSAFEENLPAGCILMTMAAQTGLGQQSQLKIDKRLFDHPTHSELSRAVLYLHEYLYVTVRMAGPRHSRDVRKAIGYLITNSPRYKITQFLDVLNTLYPRPPNANPQMVPEFPPFITASDHWIRRVVVSLVVSFRMKYQQIIQAHPEYEALITESEAALSRRGTHCWDLALAGCEFALEDQHDESLTHLMQSLRSATTAINAELMPYLFDCWQLMKVAPNYRVDWADAQESGRIFAVIESRHLTNAIIPVSGGGGSHTPFRSSINQSDGEMIYFDTITWKAALAVPEQTVPRL